MGEFNRYSEYEECMRQVQKLKDLKEEVEQLRSLPFENGYALPLGYLTTSEGAIRYLKEAISLLDSGSVGWEGSAKDSCREAITRMSEKISSLADEWREVCDDLCSAIELEIRQYHDKAVKLSGEFNKLNTLSYLLDWGK